MTQEEHLTYAIEFMKQALEHVESCHLGPQYSKRIEFVRYELHNMRQGLKTQRRELMLMQDFKELAEKLKYEFSLLIHTLDMSRERTTD